MICIHTQRLQLLALDKAHLTLYIKGPIPLAQQLGLRPVELSVDPGFWAEVPEAIGQFCLPGVEQHSDDYEWYTHWVIIWPAEDRLVGGIGFNGWPDEAGRVFVGYYVDDRYAGRGIATEAVGALMERAWQNPALQTIAADTLVSGLASQKVLQKNGFVFLEKTADGNLRWIKKRT